MVKHLEVLGRLPRGPSNGPNAHVPGSKHSLPDRRGQTPKKETQDKEARHGQKDINDKGDNTEKSYQLAFSLQSRRKMGAVSWRRRTQLQFPRLRFFLVSPWFSFWGFLS